MHDMAGIRDDALPPSSPWQGEVRRVSAGKGVGPNTPGFRLWPDPLPDPPPVRGRGNGPLTHVLSGFIVYHFTLMSSTVPSGSTSAMWPSGSFRKAQVASRAMSPAAPMTMKKACGETKDSTVRKVTAPTLP